MRDWQQIAERLAADGPLVPLAEITGYGSRSVLYRWIVNGKDGVHLDGVRIGRGWKTTRAALVRFAAECSRVAVGGRDVQASAPSGSDADRKRRAAAATLEMERFFAGL